MELELKKKIDSVINDQSCSELSWELFQVLKSAVYEASGLYLQDTRFDEVEQYLQTICATSSHSNIGLLVHEMVSQNSLNTKYQQFLKRLTHSQSGFLKQPHQENILKNFLLPEWEKSSKESDRFRILFAGCGNGKEVYSALISLYEKRPVLFKNKQIEAVGIDYDADQIEAAKFGFWNYSEIKSLPAEFLEKYFISGQDGMKIIPEISSAGQFLHANLLDEDEIAELGHFQVVFCRNVLVFYNKEIRSRMVNILGDLLVDGGYLFLDNFESLHGIPHQFIPVHFARVLSYQKKSKEQDLDSEK
ncbi:MAG: protein-glutamate O-methyltransferase CheR [Calditrichia bacterium]